MDGTYIGLRAAQWGGPIALVALVHFGPAPGWIHTGAVTLGAYHARKLANRRLAHRNMRAYIQGGGLDRDATSVYAHRVGL